MELESMITPYVESLVNQSLQDIEPLLNSDGLYDQENIKNFLEGISTLEDELKSMGGEFNSHIKDKINEINNRIRLIDTLGENE